MALATTCPYCKISFKVVVDQLKLHRGMVRCGACQRVFSGFDFLVRIPDESVRPETTSAGTAAAGDLKTAFFLPETIMAAPTATPRPALPEALPEAQPPATSGDEGAPIVDTADQELPALGAGEMQIDEAPGGDAEAPPPAAEIETEAVTMPQADALSIPATPDVDRGWTEAALDDQDVVESLTATTAEGPFDNEFVATPPAQAAVADAQAAFDAPAPVSGTPGNDDDESAIDYFSSGRRGVGFIDRHGPFALVGALLLALTLGLQWTIAQRSMIAARSPSLAPAMSALLEPFGLRIEAPRDLESLTIESFDLQASATPGVFALSALLRNRADHAVKWPSMQLTLTDQGNRVLARKVLGPNDYLPGAGAGEGLPPRAEWPVRLALEAGDLQPAGYSVILFYP